LGAKRLALVTPYPEHLNALLPVFFAAAGFEVKAVAGTPIHDVAAVRGLSPNQVFSAARALSVRDVDAVCLLATDVQTFPIIEKLERELDRPVLSSNQALLWASLRALEVREQMHGLGKLLCL
jgi:maleate cis-trans isomerase